MAELAGLVTVGLDGVVDGVDVVVGGGRDRQVLTTPVAADPGVGDVVEMLEERSGEDAVVVEVGVETSRITVSQLQGRGGFPVVTEPMDWLQFEGASGRAQLGEHAAAADGLELVRITNQRQPPVLLVGESW